MVPVTNERTIFKESLKGPFIPGQTTMFDGSQTIDVDDVSLNGGILLKTLILSLEFHVLSKLRPGLPISYKIGYTMEGNGVGVVVRSETPAFQVEDHLQGVYPFEEYSVQTNTEGFSKIVNKYNLHWSVSVGIAGMPGRAAFFGWKEHSHAKKPRIPARQEDGMKVIAYAHSDDKVQFLKDLGPDVAFNYKTTKTSEILAKEGPIDVHWDNVGGETLEAALNLAAKYARFIIRMQDDIRAILNQSEKSRLMDISRPPSSQKYMKTFEEGVPAFLAPKELTYWEDVARGLENAEVAFDSFLKGTFFGKSIVVAADE